MKTFKDQNDINKKALNYLIKRLKTLQNEMSKGIEKTRDTKLDKHLQLNNAYKSLAELEEAYGYGNISLEEFNLARDSFEIYETEIENKLKYKSKALKILKDFIAELTYERDDEIKSIWGKF